MMKRMLTLIFILNLFASVLKAPIYPVAYITREEGIRDQRLLNTVIQVESGGNPLQINYSEMAVGLLQIREIMLKEVNRLVGYEKYTVKDCLDSLKSIEIYWIVQNYHNPANEIFKGCQVWNGISKKNKYYKKIQAQL
jgi:hypothetical protein